MYAYVTLASRRKCIRACPSVRLYSLKCVHVSPVCEPTTSHPLIYRFVRLPVCVHRARRTCVSPSVSVRVSSHPCVCLCHIDPSVCFICPSGSVPSVTPRVYMVCPQVHVPVISRVHPSVRVSVHAWHVFTCLSVHAFLRFLGNLCFDDLSEE